MNRKMYTFTEVIVSSIVGVVFTSVVFLTIGYVMDEKIPQHHYITMEFPEITIDPSAVLKMKSELDEYEEVHHMEFIEETPITSSSPCDSNCLRQKEERHELVSEGQEKFIRRCVEPYVDEYPYNYSLTVREVTAACEHRWRDVFRKWESELKWEGLPNTITRSEVE